MPDEDFVTSRIKKYLKDGPLRADILLNRVVNSSVKINPISYRKGLGTLFADEEVGLNPNCEVILNKTKKTD